MFAIVNYFIKNKLAKEVFWSFSTKGVSFLLYLSLNIYLARTLKVEKYGMWSFFYSIFTIILFFSCFGISSSAQKYIAQYSGTEKLSVVLKNSLKLGLIFNLAFAFLLFFIHNFLANLIGRPEFATLFLFSSVLILSAGFLELLKNIFIGLHRIRFNFIIALIEFGLKLILTIVFLNFSLKLLSVLSSFVGATTISFTIGVYLLYKNFYNKSMLPEKEDFTKDILKYSLPLFVVGINYLVLTEIDTVMLGLLSTDREVGIYAVAKQIAGNLPHISLAMAMGVMPVFAKLNKENKKELERLFHSLLKRNFYIFLPIAVTLLFFSGFFIPFIFGIKYLPSVLPLRILTLYVICLSFLVFFDAFLNYQQLVRKRVVNMSISMAINIILNIFLIPKYGAVGTAIATAVSQIPCTILNWREVRKQFSCELLTSK
ncbi:flippase [bacterium]|nr:flippase [bacterium]MBU1152618.1 flippase [bacterium]MBU2600458.1 flippase [bacterium]